MAFVALALGLALSVGVSVALESGAAHVHPAPHLAAPPLAASVPPPKMGSPGSGAAVVSERQVDQGDRNVRNNQKPAAQPLSRSQAVTLAQRRYRARVVRAHTLQGHAGHALYELRLLSASGTVWTVHIDASSGAEIP